MKSMLYMSILSIYLYDYKKKLKNVRKKKKM